MSLQSPFEAQTHATFESLMWALAYPGRVGTVPLVNTKSAFEIIAEALIDLETSAWSDDPIFEKILRRLGAKVKALDQADYVFCQTQPAFEWLHLIRRGSPLLPESAAMLIVNASLESGQGLRLSGAGIAEPLEVTVGLPPAFFALREQVIAFPVGWDVLIVDGTKLMGLPRTTRIEVV